MARKYDIEAVLGPDFEFELTPDVLAYELSMDFSNQIIKQCADTGVSLRELASLMGIGASTLSEKLNGQNLTLKSIASMALALGCDVKAPELILEPEVACNINSSWSLPLTVAAANPAPKYEEAWPASESSNKSKTVVAIDEEASSSYLFDKKLRKAA